ncbi:MAG: glycosyltransferase [Flavobacteriales bacterium]|jgi:glycosyltransferase involved in cell wall biosynthesis|nr:glycosyltransferase [Flavobacteriales bacterium]MBK7101164.1 glycosyltransferase [Flavobacteriales bacterium]MBK7482113.1 glycosyltransferase [Flavobacteriales bacterium]MBK7619085.1 glycosyltransferase [Flavobacteriales bacterium]MBK8532074.1 glycosyltransferase [Flavobacteriales bacterium]
MKASVVIPVYNKAPFLKECLESVFAQSFQAFEVIAVDDASTDGSLDVLRSCTDPRLRIIELERNVGPGGAAQRAMDAAQGEYILRVDADDILFPERFAKQVALLDQRPEIGVCSGHLQLLSEPNIVHRVEIADVDCKARMLFGVPINQPAAAYRRSVLVGNDIRFRDHWPRYGEDWMQQIELAKVTRFQNLNEPLIHYRHGKNNIAYGRDRAADLRALYRHVFTFFGFPMNDEELELQLMTVRCVPIPIDRDRVRTFRAWLDRLAASNERLQVFDTQALQRQLDRIWNDFFYLLPAYGWSPSVAHWGIGQGPSWKQLYYLLAVQLKGGAHERLFKE